VIVYGGPVLLSSHIFSSRVRFLSEVVTHLALVIVLVNSPGDEVGNPGLDDSAVSPNHAFGNPNIHMSLCYC
jgi:hypothetical protein